MIERIAGMVLLMALMIAPGAAAEKIKVAHNRLLPPFAEVKDGKTVVDKR